MNQCGIAIDMVLHHSQNVFMDCLISVHNFHVFNQFLQPALAYKMPDILVEGQLYCADLQIKNY